MFDNRFTVLAADDHPVVLSGIRLLLRSEADFDLVAETHDAATTLAAVERLVPDLVILDLWMGGNDGFELLKQIRACWPEIRILAYSMNDERVFGRRVLQAGAAGYLMKSHGLDELLKALRVVADGGRYVSAALAAELADTALRSIQDPAKPAVLAALTDRELQILRLIGSGQTTAFIAETLHISPKTVGAHREHLKDKLGLTDAAALARHAALLVESRVL